MEHRGWGSEGLEGLTERILGAAFEVHSSLGAGLLESTYEVCLEYELKQRGLGVERQKELPVRYGEIVLDAGYRIDLLVESLVIVEVKSIQSIAPVHLAQVLTYLKLTGLRVGLLLNFNVPHLRDGIRRVSRSHSPSLRPSPPLR